MSNGPEFAAPGKLLLGEGGAEGARQAAARTLLWRAQTIAAQAGVPVYRMHQSMPDGTKLTAIVDPSGNRIVVEAPPVAGTTEPAPTLGSSNLVWLPEGFVITPRTAAAPDGYGLPPTKDKFGTPGGPAREVIINRFKDNQYPDAIFKRMGVKLPKGDRANTNILCYADWQVAQGSKYLPGIAKGKQVYRQFNTRWAPNFREKAGSQWYCHRPEYAIEPELQAAIRQYTNIERKKVGREALTAPIRGTEGALAEAITFLNYDSHVGGHDSYKYKPQYESFEYRVRAEGRTPAAGENVFATSAPDFKSARAAQAAVAGWVSSPGHYANMISDWYGDKKAWGTVDSSGRSLKGSYISEFETFPYTLGSPTKPQVPPLTGAVFTQIFHSVDKFVYESLIQDQGDDSDDAPQLGFIPPYLKQGSGYFPPVGLQLITLGSVFVTMFGRRLEVFTATVSSEKFVVLAAKAFKPFDGSPTDNYLMRVVGFTRQPEPNYTDGPCYLVIFEGQAHNFLATRQEIGRYALPKDTLGQMAIPKFSASGAKVVFSYTEHEYIEGQYATTLLSGGRYFPLRAWLLSDQPATYLTDQASSERIKFVEFYGGAFTQAQDVTLPAQVTYTRGTGFTFNKTCVGEYPLLADYTKEFLVFATVSVDSSSQLIEGGLPSSRLKGILRCPTGREIVYADTVDEGGAISGTFRHIVYLDIMNPDDAILAEYEARGNVNGNVLLDTRIMFRNRALNQRLDFLANDARHRGGAPYTGLQAGASNLFPFSRVSTVSDSTVMLQVNPTEMDIHPAGAHNVVLVATGGAERLLFRGTAGGVGATGFTCVGPSFMPGTDYGFVEALGSPSVHDGVVASIARYQQDFIVAGYAINPLHLYEDFWSGEDSFFRYSSLDLESITGMPGLSKNILPIGVL